MWRRIERASFEKKPSTRLSQEPCLGVKVNSNLPAGCSANQARVSCETCGMIVEDQMDCRVGRVGRIEDFEELDDRVWPFSNNCCFSHVLPNSFLHCGANAQMFAP